ncbi:MAG: hypothetical protein ACOCXJ_00835 [Planctomycetota bacterium]
MSEECGLAGPDAAVCLRVACGTTEDVVDGDGRLWQADVASAQLRRIGGGSAQREADLPLHPVALAPLLRTECVAPEGYRFDLPAGIYNLRLVVAETFESMASLERTFELRVQGDQLRTSIRPAAVAGGFGRAGLVEVSGIVVGAAGLAVDFGPGAALYGIEIVAGTVADQAVQLRCRALAPAPAAPPDRSAPAAQRLRMLFVGHSGTFYWAMPETLALHLRGSRPDIELVHEACLHGGKDVRFFCEWTLVEERLSAGAWDAVVVQDSSWGPIEAPEIFREWMPRLIDRVHAVGALPVCYAYHGPARHGPDQRRELMQRYASMAREQGAALIPAVSALDLVRERHPTVALQNPDGHHLGINAGYTNACCFLRVIGGVDPREPLHTSILGGHAHLATERAAALAACAAEACTRWWDHQPGAVQRAGGVADAVFT